MNYWLFAAILVVVAVLIYLWVGQGLLVSDAFYTQAQAEGYARQELSYRYPSADIQIFEASNRSAAPGKSNWLIKAKVAYGLTTTCPALTLVEMDQKFNFVPREQAITENCEVLGCKGVPDCVIAFPEEAIIMPFDGDRNPSVQPALSAFVARAGGMDNLTASAVQRAQYTSASNKTYSDVWVVTYTTQNAAKPFEAILNGTGGAVLEAYEKGV